MSTDRLFYITIATKPHKVLDKIIANVKKKKENIRFNKAGTGVTCS